MGNTTNKDDLLKLLKTGQFKKFNENRSYDEENFDLTETDFKETRIEDTNFTNVDLSGSDFSETELSKVDFSGSNLSAVNFSHATLNNCCFSDTILEGSVLSRSAFINCDFTATEFNGANICGADLTNSDLSLCENLIKTSYNKETSWPQDECLPDEFDPETNGGFAEIEDEDSTPEDEFAY